MDGEFGLAGVGAGQVLRGAGIHTGVIGAGVEDNEGVFWVIVHKCEVAALGEQHIILQQTNQLLIRFSPLHNPAATETKTLSGRYSSFEKTSQMTIFSNITP